MMLEMRVEKADGVVIRSKL